MSRIADFIKAISEIGDARIINIVTNPNRGYAIVYVRVKSDMDRQSLFNIADVAKKHGLYVSVVTSRDVHGRAKNMVIVRELR